MPDSRARARRAVRFLQVAAGMDLLALFSYAILFAGAGDDTSLWEDGANSVVFLSLFSSLAAQVGLLMWFHRLVRQLNAQGADMGVTPSMAVWWWLIPFANWVKPFQLMKDAAERLGGAHFAAALPISLWWGANILARLLDQVGRQVAKAGVKAGAFDSVDGTSSHLIGIISSLCLVATALFCVQIIRALQERMDQRREGYEAVDGAPAPVEDVAEAA
ncbi:DUF4328 domain-containing protein [Corallococcus soli]|uniref:DUF4328 domain-containing protein n=1 Tax=Corallococcus soli TaxID=2710757 RepID=UPI0039EFF17A